MKFRLDNNGGRVDPSGYAKNFMSRALILGAVLVVTAGCELRRAMYDQPKYKTYGRSELFKDGRAARPIVENTVARGHLDEDEAFFTGKTGGKTVDVFPFPVTSADMRRGRERFEIYCSVCHGYTGQGNGMIVQRGYAQPPSFHIDRLRKENPGYFFDVITNGFGRMPSYANKVKVKDRWAIAAYLKALQLSQHATINDVPADQRAKLDEPATQLPQHGREGHQ